MKNEDKLSIVIITCNRKKELEKTIESCINMAGMPIEIVIVDNGSQDGTIEFLRSYQNNEFVSIIPFFSDRNLGVSGGRNKGYELASSDIIFFIDDDAIITEKSAYLSYAYNYMMNKPQIGALAFEIYDTKVRGYLKDDFLNHDMTQKKIFSYIGACHMIRKIENKKILYPPKLMYGSEERYAAFAYHKRGFDIEYYSEIKCLHNPSKKTRLSPKEISRNVIINHYVIKQLVLPDSKKFISCVYFLLRQIKNERFNIIQIIRNYIEVNKRIRDNLEAIDTLDESQIDELVRGYGKFLIQ